MLAGTVALVATLTAPTLASAARPGGGVRGGHPTAIAPRHVFGRGTSTNWSGYAVGGKAATHVIGSWTQPAVTCSAGENSWSSPWVGIDGNNSSTVEQIGTDSDCQNGTAVYYAWYEMYPKSLVTVSMAVHPGDSFTSEVTYSSSGSFLLKLTNSTTGQSFQTTQRQKSAKRTSVEWIMEGPSSGLLSNFGSIPFTAASATIGNQTGSLGSFASAQSITMVNRQGVARAMPSAVTGGTSFGVNWLHG